jgi:hypothetical protein
MLCSRCVLLRIPADAIMLVRQTEERINDTNSTRHSESRQRSAGLGWRQANSSLHHRRMAQDSTQVTNGAGS